MLALSTIELGGEAYYAALADRVADEGAATLLRRNGREEAGHARRLWRAVAAATGTPYTPTDEVRAVPPVRLADELVVDAAMLTRLVQGELDGDLTYQRWADNEPDEAVA